MGLTVSAETYGFDLFRAIPSQRLLLRAGKPVRLGSRAFDILIALLEHAGETLTADALIARVWPDTTVDEGALRVHLTALRKALGKSDKGGHYFSNLRGEGYRFDLAVTRLAADTPSTVTPDLPVRGNVPASLTSIIGRDGLIAVLTEEVRRHRLLTVVGPGGIGKTTVALAVARAVQQDYRHGVWLVELGTVPTADLVSAAVAAALGVPSRGADSAGLAGWMLRRQLLVVLDCCEHVIGAAAELVETLQRAAPGLRVIATSREPLRVDGERLHRLASLAMPPDRPTLTACEALRCPAIQLFDERARAAAPGFELIDADVPTVLEICQKLDGVPLALELAAARLDAFNVQDLAAHLDRRFGVLNEGRRAALPRQQTLRATMDWSYELLSETEKLVLQRLGVFAGEFTLSAVSSVIADSQITPSMAIDCVADLVEKSLIVTDFADGFGYYRLLDTTRCYVLDELTKSGERDRMRRLHIDWVRRLFGGSNASTAHHTPRAQHRQIGNLRVALEWAFSANGDNSLGTALVTEVTDFWLAAGLLNECVAWTTKSLAHVRGGDDLRQEMILCWGRGMAQLFASGMQEAADVDLRRASRLAEQLQDVEYQRRATYGLWVFAMRSADLRSSRVQAQCYQEIAPQDIRPTAQAVGRWMLGMSEAYAGNLDSAGERLQWVVDRYPATPPFGEIERYGFHISASASACHAMTLWLRGFSDTALEATRRAVDVARISGHSVSICLALAWPASLLLLDRGELAAAESTIAELRNYAAESGLAPCSGFALCAEGSVASARGDPTRGVELIRRGLVTMQESCYHIFHPIFLTQLAKAHAELGQHSEGLQAIDDALQQTVEMECLWLLPEALRIKGDLLGLQATTCSEVVETLFSQSMTQAQRQGALHWQLCTAISLVKFRRVRGQANDGRRILESLYRCFREGLETPNLRQARTLLRQPA
jgi:predicted ATPase/DNA-binding winged helix-turn-helix (wHTH) protein